MLGKFPVIQHVLFGTILHLGKATAPSSEFKAPSRKPFPTSSGGRTLSQYSNPDSSTAKEAELPSQATN